MIDDRAIIVGGVLTWAALLALLASKGVNGLQATSYASNLILYLSALVFFLIFAMGRELFLHRPERPIPFLIESVQSNGLVRRFMRGAPILLALVIFMPAFSAMKSAIPLFNSYTWDSTWINLDRALHGDDVWRILQPILGYPVVSSVLSVFYHSWILLIYAGEIWFCFFVKDRQLRTQFFIANFASWALLGSLLAAAVASVGPCFLAPLLGDHRFDEQMAYLRSANEQFPVLTVPVQDALIAWYTSGSSGLGRGISAMPSMHVSFAFLFFLAMRQIGRAAGVFFGAFCAIVLVASVHLGYHYAVDGYVSIALTWAIWIVAGAAARRLSPEEARHVPVPSLPPNADPDAPSAAT